MAEVAGLVLGSVALASLFKSCIELFDYFELGRNYAYDYRLACTKMCLLKARLSTWGASLSIEKTGHEHPALRQHWGEERDVIGRSLFGIKEIFENASLLAEKYRLTPKESRTFTSSVPDRPLPLQSSPQGTGSARAPVTRWAFLRKRTVWAIHDKQKFDSFIQDLSFLIENLEKVTKRIAMPVIHQDPAATKQLRKSDAGEQSLVVVRKDHTTSHQPVSSSTKTPKQVYRKGEPLNVEEMALKLNGDVFAGNQHTDDGVVVMGNVGKSENRRNLYCGDQTAAKNGFAVMGNVSEKAASHLRQPKHRHGKQLARIEHSSVSESDDVSDSSEEKATKRDSRAMNLRKG